MVGGVVSIKVTVWLQVAVLPQESVALQVRVAAKVFPQKPVTLVIVPTMLIVAVPHVSLAVGASKFHAVVHSTVLLGTQVIVGAVVSTSVTIWEQVAVLPQESVARHVRVAAKVFPQNPVTLVTVPRIVIVAVPQESLAVGASKFQAVVHSTVLLGAQVI